MQHPYAGVPGNPDDQQLGQRIDGERVPRPDWRHVHQLPFKQLDPVVFTQNSGLAQPMILVQRQAVPRDRMAAQNIGVASIHN